MYSVYQHWDPLKVCLVGKTYPPEFYSWIKNSQTRNRFEKLAEETEEDYQGLIKLLSHKFGVKIHRPNFPDNLADLYIDGNGTGGVRLGNFRIVDNVITNVVAGAISQIVQSGTGYFKIAGTNGFVPPVGDNAQRPTGYEALGMTRYNTFSKALEIWDGLTWASPAGSSGAVSINQAEDIAVQIALTLG
jgi:hypothetical protein